jgi:hypothetical protein
MVLQAGSNTCTQDKGKGFCGKSEPAGANQLGIRFQHLRSYTMRTLLASSTVLFTILVSFAFGIACGYVVIFAILRTFIRRPKVAPAAKSAAPAKTVAAAVASASR